MSQSEFLQFVSEGVQNKTNSLAIIQAYLFQDKLVTRPGERSAYRTREASARVGGWLHLNRHTAKTVSIPAPLGNDISS